MEVKPHRNEWEFRCRRLLKSELIRKGVTYAQLREKLIPLGIELTEVNIRSRLSRGTFSAAFLLASLTAIGVTEIKLD